MYSTVKWLSSVRKSLDAEYKKMKAARKAIHGKKLKKDEVKWQELTLRRDRERKRKATLEEKEKNIKTRLPAFGNKQSLYRSFMRPAEALPKSSQQRVTIIGELLSRLSSTKKTKVLKLYIQ